MNTHQIADVYINQDEKKYLELARKILNEGEEREDRTGMGTYSLFGEQLKFDLTNNKLPLFTTKKVWWKGVVEELLWFISGSTDERALSATGVGVWKANDDGHNGNGDLGPCYGHQWRHFGSEYIDHHTDYSGQGVDQLKQVIEEIRTNPTSRRLLVSAWNPKDLPKMALPPCHVSFQFYVNIKTNELSCHMYQRSADLGLGVPFNVASYGLLTHMVAKLCGLTAKQLIISFGDVHIYKNHVDGLLLQVDREPFPFPTVEIVERDTIDEFTSKDLVLKSYKHHQAVSFKMAP